MATQVEICNSALTQIGATTIASLTENSKNAEVCNQRYHSIKHAVLRSHPWNFAVTRVSLSPTGATPAFGFASEFALPRNCLRVLNLSKLDIPHRVEKDKILCDEGTLEIMYVADVSENMFDGLFEEALIAKIAADICYPIVGSVNLADYFRSVYEEKLKEARFVDATEGTPASIDSVSAAGSLEADVFIRSRF